jgi:putative addiction module component (TIGR02574 family)
MAHGVRVLSPVRPGVLVAFVPTLAYTDHVSPRFAELRAEALQLPEDERLRLAEELFESVEGAQPSELSPAWKAEISRRLKSIEDGTAVLHDHNDVMRELRAKYGF